VVPWPQVQVQWITRVIAHMGQGIHGGEPSGIRQYALPSTLVNDLIELTVCSGHGG
jgi:hypothetical protein